MHLPARILQVAVPDRPGSLAKLLTLLSSSSINIKHINSERTALLTDVFSVRVKASVCPLSILSPLENACCR